MPHEFRKKWKEAKQKLKVMGVKINRGSLKRFGDMLTKSTTIAEHFDAIDKAIEKDDKQNAIKHHAELLKKVKPWLEEAAKVSEEFGKTNMGAEQKIVADVSQSVKILVMISRGEVAEMKDQVRTLTEKQVEKNLQVWEKNLKEMVAIFNKEVSGPLASILIAYTGQIDLFIGIGKKIDIALKSPEVDEKTVKELETTLSHCFSEWHNRTPATTILLQKCEKLLPPLTKYFNRKGMEQLSQTHTYTEALDQIKITPESFRQCDIEKRNAQKEMAKAFKLLEQLKQRLTD